VWLRHLPDASRVFQQCCLEPNLSFLGQLGFRKVREDASLLQEGAADIATASTSAAWQPIGNDSANAGSIDPALLDHSDPSGSVGTSDGLQWSLVLKWNFSYTQAGPGAIHLARVTVIARRGRLSRISTSFDRRRDRIDAVASHRVEEEGKWDVQGRVFFLVCFSVRFVSGLSTIC